MNLTAAKKWADSQVGTEATVALNGRITKHEILKDEGLVRFTVEGESGAATYVAQPPKSEAELLEDRKEREALLAKEEADRQAAAAEAFNQAVERAVSKKLDQLRQLDSNN